MSAARRLAVAALAGALVVLWLVVVSLGRPASAAGTWDCNPWQMHTSSAYRYCRESPHGGPYYVSVRLVKYDPAAGGLVYKWKDGTQETPHVGLGSWVGWNDDVWEQIDRRTVEICGVC